MVFPVAMTKPIWIRASTAAALRGVSRQSIYWHVSQGNLKSMELDGNLFVDRDEVLNWRPKGKGEYRARKKKPDK